MFEFINTKYTVLVTKSNNLKYFLFNELIIQMCYFIKIYIVRFLSVAVS